MTRARLGDYKQASKLLAQLTAQKSSDTEAWRLLVGVCLCFNSLLQLTMSQTTNLAPKVDTAADLVRIFACFCS